MRNGLVIWASMLVVCAGSAVAAAEPTKVGLIEIEGALQERAKMSSPFGSGGKGTTQMRDVLQGIENVATDAELKGLCIQLKDAQLKGSQIEEMGRAIRKVREAGKRVHIFSENYETHELQLGSFADEVIIQAGGAVSLPGVYMEEMFLADTFKWVGITPDFVQIGDYKGASEQYANAKPSKAWDENINQLLDSMYAQVRSELKHGRKLDDKKLDAAMETLWMARGEDAKKAGLIDAIVDKPDLRKHLATVYHADSVAWDDTLIPEHEAKFDGNFMAMLGKLMAKPDHEPKRDTIAVLHIDGAIVDGDSSEGGILGGGGGVGSRTIRNALMEIEKNDLIKGCIVRIDSPGGSAIASEIIWQGLRRIAAKGKPIWSSVGSMAASGGYYVAVGTDKVYVNESSIVGSIGVVGGKMAMGGAFEKLKVNVVGRSRGPRADMQSSSKPWSEAERGLVRAKMTETYDQFTGRVTSGRKGIDLSKTAEGRLFLGQKAIELKMADNLGGLEEAVGDMAKQLSLSERSFDVMDYPAPKGLGEMLGEMLGGMGGGGASSPLHGRSVILGEFSTAARELVGERSWGTISSQIEGLMQLRNEPVLLVSPQGIIIK